MLQKLTPRRFGALASLFDFGRVRAFLRRSELGMILAGAFVGVTSGCAVTAMSLISRLMHTVIFSIDDSGRLSSAQIDNKFIVLAAPVAGGIILGIMMFILAKTRKK